MSERIPASQLAEWAAFERVEGPLLIQQRLDIAAARIAVVVARGAGMKKRGGGEIELSDFLIDWDEEKAEARFVADLGALFAKEAASQPSTPSS